MAAPAIKDGLYNASLMPHINIPNTLDQELCNSIGKVVHLTARLKDPTTDSIVLRGDKGSLGWDKNLSHSGPSPLSDEIHFTFSIPTTEMNDTLMCKLVSVGSDGKLKWQNCDNIVCDLSRYGHIAAIEVNNVSF